MKKKLSFIFIIFVLCLSSVNAVSPSVYLKAGYLYSYDTNVFSYPLVKNATLWWLNWRVKNPYEERFNNGFHFETDLYFTPSARTGLSISLDTGFAYRDNRYIPVGDFNADWDYVKYDGIAFAKPRLFAGIGPSFRALLGNFDIGVNIRASLGSYDFSIPDIVFGITAEPYMNVFVTDVIFLSTGLHYDAHLMSFHLNSDTEIFSEDYIMVTFGGFVGLGICFGSRGL